MNYKPGHSQMPKVYIVYGRVWSKFQVSPLELEQFGSLVNSVKQTKRVFTINVIGFTFHNTYDYIEYFVR